MWTVSKVLSKRVLSVPIVSFDLSSWKDYWLHHRWSGSCPDPKLILEQLKVPLEDMVKSVLVEHKNGTKAHYKPAELEIKGFSPFHHEYGQCYQLDVFHAGAVKVTLFVNNTFQYKVHSPGLFREDDGPAILLQADWNYMLGFKMTMEAFHLLDYMGGY